MPVNFCEHCGIIFNTVTEQQEVSFNKHEKNLTVCKDCVKRLKRFGWTPVEKPVNLLNSPEPAPVKNDKPYIWELVMEDMKARDDFGKQKYGTGLQPFNGRDSLKDLYQELLDALAYTRQLIFERDGK